MTVPAEIAMTYRRERLRAEAGLFDAFVAERGLDADVTEWSEDDRAELDRRTRSLAQEWNGKREQIKSLYA